MTTTPSLTLQRSYKVSTAAASPVDSVTTCSAPARSACSNGCPLRRLPSYLSGLLIGHELREHRGNHATVHLVGSPGLAQRYALALQHVGVERQLHPEDLAATGLFALARQRGLA